MNVKNACGQPGRRDPPHAAAEPRRGRPRGASTFELVQPAAQRPPATAGARRGTRCVPGTDTAVMLAPRPRARHRGPARHRLPRALLRRRRPSHRLRPRRRATAWPRRPSGRRPSPASPRTTCATSPGAWRRSRTLVTVSWALQRTAARRAAGVDGHRARRPARPDRPARAAASATATARWPTSARPRVPYPLPVLRQGRNPVDDLHPGRPDHRAARATPAARSTTTARACRSPTSASCTGRAATPSTTTRT